MNQSSWGFGILVNHKIPIILETYFRSFNVKKEEEKILLTWIFESMLVWLKWFVYDIPFKSWTEQYE